MQGRVVELPIPQFETGVMRGRFHPEDGQLYACGLSAWATNQVLQEGGLYRVRYTGKRANLPVGLNALENGLKITFTDPLDPASVADPANFQVKTWALKRTRSYGSDRYDTHSLTIASAELKSDGETVFLNIPDISPVWIMEISYQLRSASGEAVNGVVQNTIHELGSGEVLN